MSVARERHETLDERTVRIVEVVDHREVILAGRFRVLAIEPGAAPCVHERPRLTPEFTRLIAADERDERRCGSGNVETAGSPAG